jgi:hypothetical protein
LKLDYMDLHMFKALMATYYRPTYKQLLRFIVSGKLLHVDETEVKLRLGKGYVWVFTTMEEVVFIYRPTREGGFLANLLKGFTGVLVSDFYSAYDSLNCAQQKCLIHLMRDMNNDLLNSPFDEEYKELVGSFGKLLRSIVYTIDQYGLLKRHLNKHIREVDGFYENLQSRAYMSEVASQYQGRLHKHRDKLFTFLHYDGIPWNNNNAEHAVKRFAHYRFLSDGNLTESGLNDYLVLLSIRETCRYKGVDFLKFLLSRERDINTFCEARGNTTRRDTVELYPQGFPCRYKSRARGEDKEMKEGKED